jgi:hypothetical protein
MNVRVHCFEDCKNEAIPLPPYPPFWTGGGGAPVDPTAPYVFCPTIPSTIQAGSANATVRVTGQNFVSGTHIVWMNGVQMPTTFVSASELSFTATHIDRTTAGVETIEVRDGATVIPTICQFTYTLAPLMVVTCPVVPISLAVGTGPTTVRVNGQNFTNTCVGTLDGTDLPTVYVSPTQLNVTIDATAETVRQALIGARNTTTGYVSTVNCPFDFTQSVLVPTISYIWPDMIGRSNPGELVTITGTNFNATDSVVMRGVQPLPTTFVNDTTLTITSTDVTATTGSFDVRVRNGPAGAYELSPMFYEASCALNPTNNMLIPNTVAAGSAPLEIKFLGNNLGNTAEILVDDVPVPTRWVSGGDVRFDVDPSAMTPGTVLQVCVRLGHDHPEGHDDVRAAVAPFTLPLTIT